MESVVRVRPWGNALGVRIPVAIARRCRLTEGSNVTVRVERDRVVIEPARQTQFDLDTLLSEITDTNQHAAIDTGRPLGKEVL